MWGWRRALQGRLIARGQGDRARSRLSFCCKMERWVDGPPVRTVRSSRDHRWGQDPVSALGESQQGDRQGEWHREQE